MKRTQLAKIGKHPVAQAMKRIQALLRQIVIIRDGGCVLRLYPETGACSGPLQAEHLNSRTHAHTFGDTRNIVCLCQRHHIFWKPQNSRRYWEIIQIIIGKTRWAWLKLAEADHSPHKVDWAAQEIALQYELSKLTN